MSGNRLNTPRAVYLPPDKLEKCTMKFCGVTMSLRLCSSCGEQQYCSRACQKDDWPNHKASCGKTDRIDLVSFYPFLACLVEACHLDPKKPRHSALFQTILRSDIHSTAFPDESAIKLVVHGEEIPPITLREVGTETWHPRASSPEIRLKLFRRILREGYLLPILTSLCIGLLAEVYTTTVLPASDFLGRQQKRRIRLQYHSSPISNFGIAKGRVEVKIQDTLAYFSYTDRTFQKGQDPSDHYWLYFTTISGEEFILDCGLFTFNFGLLVPAEPYRQNILPPTSYVPAYFHDRAQAHYAPTLHHVNKRFSFLRNKALYQAVVHSGTEFRPLDAIVICEFMETIAGRNCSAAEKDLAMTWSMNSCTGIGIILQDRAWVNWPNEPTLAIETDPGEMDMVDSKEEDEAWWKGMRKWSQKYNRGEISLEAFRHAFQAWDMTRSDHI